MKTAPTATFILAAFLNLVPVLNRGLQSIPALCPTPAAIVLKWVVGALTFAGTYHAVSAASAVLVSGTSIAGKFGTRLSYQIKISDGSSRLPESWVINGRTFGKSGSTTFGMPTGLSLGLATGIISGVPTEAGNFPVSITAYEKAQLKGAELSFTLAFTISGGASPPAISTPPMGGTVAEGSSFVFSVVASGSAPLMYQWRHNGLTIAGENTSTLTLDAVQLSDEGEYTVIISNSAGSTASPAVQLLVTTMAVAIEIINQPVSMILHEGEPLTLAVGATGIEPLTYQWRHNGVELAGQNEPHLTLPAAAESDAGEYDVVVLGPVGSVTSSAASVTVVALSIHVLGMSSEGISLGLETIPGREYILEGTAGGLGADWQILTHTAATDTMVTFVDPKIHQGLRFWRYGVSPGPASASP